MIAQASLTLAPSGLPEPPAGGSFSGEERICPICGARYYKPKRLRMSDWLRWGKTCGDKSCQRQLARRTVLARPTTVLSRDCAACGRTFHPRPDEKPSQFLRRVCCSRQCANQRNDRPPLLKLPEAFGSSPVGRQLRQWPFRMRFEDSPEAAADYGTRYLPSRPATWVRYAAGNYQG